MTWFDQIGTALFTFNACVNPVLYSMRMKKFRDHLRDMLLCKKRQRARGQGAVVCGEPTTLRQTESVNPHVTPQNQHCYLFHQHLDKRWSRQNLNRRHEMSKKIFDNFFNNSIHWSHRDDHMRSSY